MLPALLRRTFQALRIASETYGHWTNLTVLWGAIGKLSLWFGAAGGMVGLAVAYLRQLPLEVAVPLMMLLILISAAAAPFVLAFFQVWRANGMDDRRSAPMLVGSSNKEADRSQSGGSVRLALGV
jgi:hypothetical protein